jgi:hypothetical protein
MDAARIMSASGPVFQSYSAHADTHNGRPPRGSVRYVILAKFAAPSQAQHETRMLEVGLDIVLGANEPGLHARHIRIFADLAKPG